MNKFSGANFCVLVSVVCFLVLFCLCFCFSTWLFVPENGPRKFSSGQVRCLSKFSGSELLFYGVGVGLVCFGAFLPMFLLYYLFFRPRNCLRKILLMSGPVFLGCFLSSFGFFRRRRRLFRVCFFFFFSREKAQVVTGHTPTRTCVSVLFPFCVSGRNRVYLPFWPCVRSFWRFVGVPFWAPGVFGILSGLL